MPIIRYSAPLRLLVSVRGHPFDRNAFDALFLAMPGVSATMVDQPAAAALMNPQALKDYDVLVLYDMPGLDFEAAHDAPAYVAPDGALMQGFAQLLDAGIGILALHHAIAGWPSWPAYGEWLGGRFLYHAGKAAGVSWPDSGYLQQVRYEACVLAEHPVTAGLPHRFSLTDELYLAPVFTAGLTPLLGTDHPPEDSRFYSAREAVSGRMNSRTGWRHPPGSNLIGWTRRARASTVVYLQPGDGPGAFENPHYRRLLENAVRWLATQDARRHTNP